MKTIKQGIMHVATDEKFIANANHVFTNAFPDVQNDFFIVLDSKNEQLVHVKQEANIQLVVSGRDALNLLQEKSKGYQLVVIHYLSDFAIRLVNRFSLDVKLMWLVWGGDLYESGIFKGNLYGPLTEMLARKTRVRRLRLLLGFLKYTFLKYRDLRLNHKKMIEKAFKRLDLVGCLAREEFDYISSLDVLKKDVEYIRFSYYPIDFSYRENMDLKVSSNNILLGNSATMTNNHLEIMELLRRMDVGSQHIIVPLSYGDTQYAQFLKGKGEQYFNSKFDTLMTFVPLVEYQRIINSCNVAIMNHYRQQAIGNILSMFFIGAKVFLSDRSVLYTYFKRIGYEFYSIEAELNKENIHALESLNEKEKLHNKTLVLTNHSASKIIDELKDDLMIYLIRGDS